MDGDIKKVHTSKGDIECFGVILATGASPRMIGFQGEAEFKGHGVAYCATCDGEFFKGKEVFVVGGGFAAAEESVFLTKYAKHVTILIREPDFTCAKTTAQHAYDNENITVLTHTEVVKVEGGDVLERTSLVKDFGILDERGYVITDASKKTAIDGLYAAGDVCIKPLRQVVTTVGDAGIAATELEKYISVMHKKTGIKPVVPIRQSGAGKGSLPKEEVKEEGLFSSDMLAQLNTVFGKMENDILLKVYVKDDDVSKELLSYMTELGKLTDKISVEEVKDEAKAPVVEIHRDGEYSGLAFHGVPGGHEFTSFILGIYNVSGPGQGLSDDIREKILNIKDKVSFKILVSLSCTMCPDLVVAVQRIASLNENIDAQVYDINHFGDLREKYHVMSVPCLVMNEDKVFFGKKSIEEVLEYINN